ncbi:MAG: AI-2E family transporter [Methanosarcina sp.]
MGDVNINENTTSTPAKILIYSTAAILLTLGMKEIAPILIPVIFSIFAFLIFAPLVHWFQRKGIPGKISVILVILLFIIAFIGSVILVVSSLVQLSTLIPTYQIQLTDILDRISEYLPEAGFSVESFLRNAAAITFNLTSAILTGALNAGSIIAVIFITTTFLLLDAAGAPRKVKREVGDQPALALRVTEFGKSLVSFILLRTETNLIAGIGTAILLLLGRIEFAVLWGFLTFLLGYIPYLGFYLAALPPMLLALFKYGPIGAIAVLAGIALINTLVENVLFPSIAGKGLKLSMSIVFLSLFYWSYVLGASGALIAVPLTMAVKLILENSRDTRWMAKLMEPADSRDKESTDREDS